MSSRRRLGMTAMLFLVEIGAADARPVAGDRVLHVDRVEILDHAGMTTAIGRVSVLNKGEGIARMDLAQQARLTMIQRCGFNFAIHKVFLGRGYE